MTFVRRWAVLGLVVFLAVGCDEEPTPVDSGPSGMDSGPMGTDSGPMGTDSGPMGTDSGPAVDSGPPGTGHCAATDLILESIDPGTSITIFNPTSSPIAIDGSSYQLCMRPAYVRLSIAESGVTIAAGGSHTFPWPPGFSDTDAGGEVALYDSGAFSSAASLIDFVCWGTGRSASRKTTAEADGDWVGPCAGAITGDSLDRIPESDGTGASSYDPTGSAAALSCP